MSVAWVAVGATVLGTAASAKSAKKASRAQQESAADANDNALLMQRESQTFQQKQLDQSRTDSEPWRLAGQNALGQLTGRMGAGGDLMRNFGASDFEADPGYQFRLAEGMRGLTNSASARGGILSGAALKAASAYNQNMGSAEYGNAYGRFKSNQEGQYNKLASLAGVGQTVSSQNGQNALNMGQNVGNGMMNTATQMGQNTIGAGNARASGYLAQGNMLTNGLNQGVSAWNQFNKPPVVGTPNASNVTPNIGWG